MLMYKDKAILLDHYSDEKISCSGGKTHPVPAVLLLKEYTSQKGNNISYSRKNVFIRYRLKCQYCNQKFKPQELTLDHVHPRSLWDNQKNGTPTKFTNIVTCCYSCNSAKADKTLEQSGMKLKRQPKKPSAHGFVLGLAPWNTIEQEWEIYLPIHYKQILGLL